MYPLEELQKKIDAEIVKRTDRLTGRKPGGLYAPVEYSLSVGGKRLRPVLLLLGYNIFSEDVEKVLPAAFALEVFHNFTLLHDDIMDEADMRRNKPTAHLKFGVNNAILSGDAMVFLSYQNLFECQSPNLMRVMEMFTKSALEVCKGQQYDMDFENRMEVTEAEYLKMIKLKTAVLLGLSLKAGVLLADGPEEIAGQLYDFGLNLGMAFQLQDDWLDSFGNQKFFGKKIGGDILSNKKTFLLISALQRATGKTKSDLVGWLKMDSFNRDKKISAVIDIYNQLGVSELTRNKIDEYIIRAEEIVKNITLKEEAKKRLLEFTGKISNREV